MIHVSQPNQADDMLCNYKGTYPGAKRCPAGYVPFLCTDPYKEISRQAPGTGRAVQPLLYKGEADCHRYLAAGICNRRRLPEYLHRKADGFHSVPGVIVRAYAVRIFLRKHCSADHDLAEIKSLSVKELDGFFHAHNRGRHQGA